MRTHVHLTSNELETGASESAVATSVARESVRARATVRPPATRLPTRHHDTAPLTVVIPINNPTRASRCEHMRISRRTIGNGSERECRGRGDECGERERSHACDPQPHPPLPARHHDTAPLTVVI